MEGKLNLVSKLVQVMKAIDHVEKMGLNKFQNYAYVKASDIARAARNELVKQNVLMLSEVISERCYTIPAKEGVMQAIDIKVQYEFRDGDSQEILRVNAIGTGADKGDKAVYKAHTGALKYALRNTFLIPDESDPEADEETDRATAHAQAIAQEKIKELKTQKASIPNDQFPDPAENMDAEPTNAFITALSQKKTKKGSIYLSLKYNQLEANCWDTALFPFLLKAHSEKLAIELGLDDPRDPRYPPSVRSILKLGKRQFENNVPLRDVNEDPNHLTY